jgi:RNA polymerase sigma factor (sigma-70 family)
MLMPINHVTGWLFQVARNRITDLFRKKQPERFSDVAIATEDDDLMLFEDLLPSSDAGPDGVFTRQALIDTIAMAVDELPEEQRDVFIAHEIDGESFKEMSARTGVNVNTLLSRKRYAVMQLRRRLQGVYDDLTNG